MLRGIAINKQASLTDCNYVVKTNTRILPPPILILFFYSKMKLIKSSSTIVESLSLSLPLSLCVSLVVTTYDNYNPRCLLIIIECNDHTCCFRYIYLITFTRWTRDSWWPFQRGKSGRSVNLTTRGYRSHNTMVRGYFTGI